ncbi:MAG: hypothetical protein PHC88_05625 [Terrimicrobiaceae bacterium]|nr:hypothetical protein [Terrimicrobiaceae bacterium]
MKASTAVKTTAEPLPSMRVRAIREGYYGRGPGGEIVRHVNDVFTLVPYEITIVDVRTQRRTLDPATKLPAMKLISVEDQFSDNWMERVPDDEKEIVTSSQQAINRQIADLNGGN